MGLKAKGLSEGYRSPTYYELAAPEELDWRPHRPESYREYRREWDRRGAEGQAGDFPLHLDIDPTNRCNLRCRMCPRTHYLETGQKHWAPLGLVDLDISLYQKIIASSEGTGLRSVKLNFLGEPLLHPRLPEMVAMAAQAGLWVMINTNAVALTPDLSRKLLAAGLTDIFFSFDSPYRQEYEAIRVGADYGKVLANIASFMEAKEEMGLNRVQTRASMVLSEGSDGLEGIKSDYIKLFRDLKVAEIGFGLPTVMGRDYSALPSPEDFVCPDLFRRLFVFNDGLCGPCCGDWERRLIVGDAGRQSISEIWNGEAYQKLRRAHLSGRHRDIPACRDCSVPYLSTVSA
ncbi:MAG: SPASM domain-containing protein [Deltaproteobacteria bacterium]|jgi:MoaA/NifB/PqqE/SkfB family radical SAM enzyme|nr:SPASM domain-containing protein [Deltaproteobacteria bacterium]